MKKNLLNIVILFCVGWIAVYVAFHGYDLIMGKPIQQQAMEAYNRGDYAAALTLFKKWGEMPDVRKDPQQQRQVIAYIIDIQNRLAPAPVPASTHGVAAGPAAGPATGPVDQSQLLQQAMSYALEQKKSALDPATGADRIPHPPIPIGQTAIMTIKQLGNFEFDPVTQKAEDVPDDVKALTGARLRLNGYMIPLTQANQIDKFALVPSLVGCCFGQPPGVQHVITVTMEKGKSVDYTLDEIDVEGILKVNPLRQDGYTYQIFEFTASSAKVKDN